MRILIRTSLSAIWARRLAALALPLTILAIAMHYGGSLEAEAFAATALLAVGTAALALLLSLVALTALWFSGDRGWGRAISALLISLICLAPAAAAGYAMWRYPPTHDVTTDAVRPPALVSAIAPEPSPPPQAKIDKTFPGVRTRRYSLDAPSVFDIVERLIDERRWQLIARTAPATGLDSGQINAMAVALGGWRDEVAVRVVGTSAGCVVDMRSAALGPGHDLGANGRRIEGFLDALDAEVTRAMRNAPVNRSSDVGTSNADSDIVTAPLPAPPPDPSLQESRPGGLN